MVRVKICGITSIDDAKAASDFGADAIGLVFAKSPRQVSLKKAEQITRALGPWISVVGVFVDENPAQVLKIAKICNLSAVQLHGSEAKADVERLRSLRVIKALHVEAGFQMASLKNFSGADAFLFDTKVGEQVGGTGKTFDWKVLKDFTSKKPVIISGGLHPQNVAQAVRFFNPYGVDVSSGVEKAAGKKDLSKVREFIGNAKKV